MIRPRPAGFWIRALAAVIDLALFALVQVSLRLIGRRMLGAGDSAMTVGPMAGFFTLIFAAAYTTVLHCLAGQTIGKMIVGVRVIAGEDTPPFGAALLRFAAYFASAATFMLGFVMAGLRHDKRALHDLIAGTRVEHLTPPEAPTTPPAATSGPVVAGVV
jgi:uncharacterized RDD family membrane protein YckC